jgi:hypothetical protein
LSTHSGQGEGEAAERILPAIVMATIYGHLGIDPAVTLPDHLGRPMLVLDDREPVRELLPA